VADAERAAGGGEDTVAVVVVDADVAADERESDAGQRSERARVFTTTFVRVSTTLSSADISGDSLQ